jgi:hypothetical protein
MRSYSGPGTSPQAKGYRRADFEDAWKRYLPVPPAPNPSNPSKRLEQAENEHSKSVRTERARTDSHTSQTRMVEPSGRIGRISPGESGGDAISDAFAPLDESEAA